jgi:hypothetical protein
MSTALSNGPRWQRNLKRGRAPGALDAGRNAGFRSRSIGPFLSIFFRLLLRPEGPAPSTGSATGAMPGDGGNRQPQPWAGKQRAGLDREQLRWAERPTAPTRRNGSLIQEPPLGICLRTPENPFQPRDSVRSCGPQKPENTEPALKTALTSAKDREHERDRAVTTHRHKTPNHCECCFGHKLTKCLSFATPMRPANYEQIVKTTHR